MAKVHLYEPNKELRSNIAEILELEGHSSKQFSDFIQFVSQTIDICPDIAICSLIRCENSHCEWSEYLNSIMNSRVMTLGVTPNCKCCKGRISINVPFTYQELADCINHCITTA